MFFRRILERKDNDNNNDSHKNNNNNNNNNRNNGNSHTKEAHTAVSEYVEDNESAIYDMNASSSECKDNNNNNNNNINDSNNNSNSNNCDDSNSSGNGDGDGNGSEYMNNNNSTNNNNNHNNNYLMKYNNANGVNFKMQRAQGPSTLQRKFIINTNEKQSQSLHHSNTSGGSNATPPTMAAASSGGGVQLSPLWAHILRTRRLPETICPASMFAEFRDRLQDPEWQVRQHALRVLVDVLVVMGAKADRHMDQLTTELVENLGHQAPTVRKGALDCLRVYLTETTMPETVMLHILDLGLNHRQLDDEPFGERLKCGVLLSLPALLQSILHTPKRHFILRAAIDMVVGQMSQVMQQEITLKVLTKISELIGDIEFEDYMSKGALHEFAHLCRVYGVTKHTPGSNVPMKTGAWRALQRQSSNWHLPKPQSAINTQTELQLTDCHETGKVIMETEIKLNDETLTMRILEADTDLELDSPCLASSSGSSSCKQANPPNSLDAEIVCRPLSSTNSERAKEGIIQVLSDSETEEPTHNDYNTLAPAMTPTRSLKRVTFGGEVVKMRTPDSDASNTQNNNASLADTSTESRLNETFTLRSTDELPAVSVLSPILDNHTTALSLDIPSDNTKPLPRPRTAQSPQRTKPSDSHPAAIAATQLKRSDSIASLSPRSPYRAKSLSPVDSIISPKAPHKEIEVLHNLQRDPSPKRAAAQVEATSDRTTDHEQSGDAKTTTPSTGVNASTAIKSWEELDIVDYKTLIDLRSGDWRNRLQGIAQLELALRSTTTLAEVQPYLDTLLRTLLSSERNYEVAEEKRDLLINLITRLPLDNLEDRTLQILNGLCRQSNAGANRMCKALMQRLPTGSIVAKLTSSEFLHAKSSKFREHALQMVIYALMTFPSTCFDMSTCVSNGVFAALNRKRRVRQAALEMLAVLGEIATPLGVLDITERIAEPLEEGAALVAGVKKRLARKQLPTITLEGAVLYAIQPHGRGTEADSLQYGADMQWITMGEGGSASPNALRRRQMRDLAKQRPAMEQTPTDLNVNYHSDESVYRHSFRSPPEAYDLTNTSNEDHHHAPNYKSMFGNTSFGVGASKSQSYQTNYTDRRLVRKTCSDSSMDGRSTDSTNTCSSGSGSSIQAVRDANAGITGRFTRQTSRFPTMDHIDLNTTFRVHRPPIYYPGMGPYAHLQQQQYNINSTYPKINYNLSRQQRKKPLTQKTSTTAKASFASMETQKKQPSDDAENLNGTYTICKDLPLTSGGNAVLKLGSHQNRFINIEQRALSKYNEDNALTTTTTASESAAQTHDGSPISIKSTSYSQKSTASAQTGEISLQQLMEQSSTKKETTPVHPANETHLSGSGSVRAADNLGETETRLLGVLVVDDLETDSTLIRNESLSSLHSKTESIKTQLEDTPQTLSRTQSVKSLPEVEEEIEDNNSFIVVEELPQQELNDEPHEDDIDIEAQGDFASQHKTEPCTNSAPTHGPWDLLSERPESKQGSLDTTSTTDYSSQTSTQLNSSIAANDSSLAKKQRPLIKERSKTSGFLRNRRRISPVKFAKKMSHDDLFTQSKGKFEKPRDALQKTFDQLDSSNWETNMLGLSAIMRLMRFHPENLDNQMHMICILLTRSVRNLRSQVSRAACQAATQLFALKSKNGEQECDDLVFALLHRTADTNRFLRSDATQALESMCDHMQLSKTLNLVNTRGVQHQNALVRTTSAKLLCRLVEQLGCDRAMALPREQRDKFIVVGANLLLEGSLETRNHAKAMFRVLAEHASYSRLLLEVIPPRTYRNVEKTLKSIKG